ncbi:unnamed protein product [Prorocentrum cordatum]|uniref:Uncharacterized protein n=1 Tax=Prorocentrum cordatum TaxID=2364126 RepID=A0ABN9YH30_9DINO|nr:unnamed protein product [Polarella glacialis]
MHAGQAQTIDKDDDVATSIATATACSGPNCPKCEQGMLWSDFSGPPYDPTYGWGCVHVETCKNWKGNCGAYRWHCSQCPEDLCRKCSVSVPAPAGAGLSGAGAA